jgi:hypothetical protein
LNRFRFFFSLLNFSLIVFIGKNRTKSKMITPTSKINCVIVIERMSSSHPQKAMSCFPEASLGEK